MSTRPTVTVGLPVHNGERYLAQAIGSILGQTFQDLELVISDNASRDATTSICAEAAGRDPRVRFVRVPENRGAAWNYNHVLELARGAFFKWAAHDDELAPTYLERCIDVATDDPDVVLVYPRTVLIDERGQPIRLYDERTDVSAARPRDRMRELIRHLRLCNMVFGVTRTEVLRSTRRIQPFAHADRVLLAELALRGRFHEVAEPLFRRRIHDEMSMRHNSSAAEIARWFDPGADPPTDVWTRLFTGHLRAVAEAPLTHRERMLAAVAVAVHWSSRYGRNLIGDLRRKAGL